MDKYLLPIGVAGRIMTSFDDARNETYTTKNNEFPPTPFLCDDNPFYFETLAAKNILEIGPGIGRNVQYIFDNLYSKITYSGIEPNPTMWSNFWKYVPSKYYSRINMFPTFCPKLDNNYDVIISTFVFQHIGYRTPNYIMNVDDITKELNNYAHNNTIWFLLEHDREEPGWIEKWFDNNNIKPDVYIRDWQGAPELNDRGLHHLIIFKGKLNYV